MGCLMLMTGCFRYIMTSSLTLGEGAWLICIKISYQMKARLRVLIKAETCSNRCNQVASRCSQVSCTTLSCTVTFILLHLTPRILAYSCYPPLIPIMFGCAIMLLSYSTLLLCRILALNAACHTQSSHL